MLLGHHEGRIDSGLAAIAEQPSFGEAQKQEFVWSKHYDTAGWLDFLQTHSDHQTLAPDRLQRLLDAVGQALERARRLVRDVLHGDARQRAATLSGSGREPRQRPALGLAHVEQAVVDPVLGAEPELDGARAHAESAPVRRAERRRLGRLHQMCVAIVQRLQILDRLALA